MIHIRIVGRRAAENLDSNSPLLEQVILAFQRLLDNESEKGR